MNAKDEQSRTSESVSEQTVSEAQPEPQPVQPGEPGGNGEATGKAAADPASPSGDELQAELEQARSELDATRDKYLRAVAELDNMRRRAENDVGNARKYAVDSFAAELLSVRDSLELAQAVEVDRDDAIVAKMKEGIDLTLKQMDSVLAKFAIQVISPQPGDKLDPERHQAMTTQPSDEIAPNHILSVIQKGYSIHERLLRPALVVVAKAAPSAAQGESA